MSHSDIAANLTRIQSEIAEAAAAAHRAADSVTLVAVSKRKPLAAIQSAYAAGHRDFGENRVQELQEKAPAMPSDIRWHLIGSLQSNKVKHALEHSYLIHSIDSEKLLRRVDRMAGEMGKIQKILLQANVSGEETKAGLDLDGLRQLTRHALDCHHVTLCGYMTMAPFGASSEELKSVFGELRNFRDRVETEWDTQLPELSMGMSGDFHDAISCGATFVRVGTAIFGLREY